MRLPGRSAVLEISSIIPVTISGNLDSEKTDNGNCDANKTRNPTDKESPSMFLQMVATLVCSMGVTGTGLAVAYASSTVPQLKDANSTTEIFLEENEIALFGSLPSLGAACGALITGLIVVELGQRRVLLVASPLCLASWLCVAFTRWVWLLNVARFVTGLSIGAIEVSSQTYVSEIAHRSIRGNLGTIITCLRNVGFFIAFCLGATNLTWRMVAIVCGVVCSVPPFVGMIFLPDSPRWLVSQGRTDEAEKSLSFYRGPKYSIEEEIAGIKSEVSKIDPTKGLIRQQIERLRSSSIRNRLFVFLVLALLVQFSGNFAVMAYAVPIFGASGANLNPYIAAIIIGAVRSVATIIYSFAADKFSRRYMFLIGAIICGVSLFGMGAFFYIKYELDLPELEESLSWLPLTSMVFFLFCIPNCISIFMVLQGEIFPTYFRSIGTSLTIVTFFLGAFIVTQLYLFMIDGLGTHGTFWVYGAIAFISSFIPCMAFPETRGKSLDEIEHHYRAGKAKKLAI